MNCYMAANADPVCLVFAAEADANTAASILNADCGTCECGCNAWATPEQRSDGKWWLFLNTNITDATFEGAGLTLTKENYSDDMNHSGAD